MKLRQLLVVTVVALMVFSAVGGASPGAKTNQTSQSEELSEECPELTEVALDDKITTDDYRACKRKQLIGQIRTRWKGRVNWLRTTGHSLLNNTLPGTDVAGDVMLGAADNIENRIQTTT